MALRRVARPALEVPRTFVGFCAWLAVDLRPGQAEFARVAYDGAEPVDYDMSRALFGAADLSLAPRDIVVAICGGRGGKSYILMALRLVWGMYMRDLSPVAPGEDAAALVIAPNATLRRQVVKFALGAVQSKPELAATLRGDPRVDGFTIWREDFNREVMFMTGAANAKGSGGRGYSLTDFGMDECAFFFDASAKVNDQEIFAAGSPRVMPGGQTIITTTPWADIGLAYELFRDNHGDPKTALVAHAPTLVLNDSEMTRAIVERERIRNPENARREFDAEFMTGGTSVFFSSELVEGAITDEPFTPEPGDVIAAGADFAFLSDSSALVVVAVRGTVLHVFEVQELRPKPGEPLKPSETVRTFAQAIEGRCSFVMADGHHQASIMEHLSEHDLAHAPAPTVTSDPYVRARMLLRERRVRIHPSEPRERLVNQMREVHGRPTAGGRMAITHPRWATGGHGDLCAALVLALWQVSGDEVAAPEPEFGTKEYEADLQERRRLAWVAKQEESAWSGKGIDRGRDAFWKRHG